jgi:segregation and condensation protein B
MLENEISTPEVETLPAEVAPASFDLATIGRQIEAILMVVDEPVTEITLACRRTRSAGSHLRRPGLHP